VAPVGGGVRAAAAAVGAVDAGGGDALFEGFGELPECAVVFGRRRELSLQVISITWSTTLSL
jgi:hypothetical protein